MSTLPSGDALARTCAQTMLARDRHAQAIGIELEEAREGYARVALTVRADMTNGHDIVHGGITFSLGDTAFAYACNSRNEPNVALQCSISFTNAARLGDRLVAVAEERTATKGRTSVYDITITRDAEVIALFRGVAYRIQGAVLSAPDRTPSRGVFMADTPIVPLISSDTAGPLGAIHLPRLWTKLTLASHGRLAAGYDVCGAGFDQMTLDAFGLDRAKTIAFVNEKHPSYAQFEQYVRDNGSVSPESVTKHNAAIRGYNHSAELGSKMRSASGLNDAAVADAVRLNMVEDLDELHKSLH